MIAPRPHSPLPHPICFLFSQKICEILIQHIHIFSRASAMGYSISSISSALTSFLWPSARPPFNPSSSLVGTVAAVAQLLAAPSSVLYTAVSPVDNHSGAPCLAFNTFCFQSSGTSARHLYILNLKGVLLVEKTEQNRSWVILFSLCLVTITSQSLRNMTKTSLFFFAPYTLVKVILCYLFFPLAKLSLFLTLFFMTLLF